MSERSFPRTWCTATLGDLFEQRLGKMLDQAKNQGIPCDYLRNVNVRWYRFDLSDVAQMRVTEKELSDISVRAGDLVVCEGGEPGRCAVWKDEKRSFVIQKALHRLRPRRGISSDFAAYQIAAEAGAGRLEAAFTGSTIKHFTGESLRAYEVRLAPTDEQHRIVAALEAYLSRLDAAVETLKRV
ncbi:MAG: restriction endonuclease subunit S, partial [Myxococcota bacterium]|nr:restriction endonuclease subunit S [Myxococcota bacterium]